MFKLKEIIRLISIRRIFGTFQTLQIFFGTCLVFIEKIFKSVSFIGADFLSCEAKTALMRVSAL